MKLQRQFGVALAAVLVSLMLVPSTFAQVSKASAQATLAAAQANLAAAQATLAAAQATPTDTPTASPTPTMEIPTATPSKPMSTKERLQALEQENQDLQTRMKALEEQAAQKAVSAGTSNSMDQVGPMGESALPTGNGGGVHDVEIPWEAGNEVLYSESRYLSFTNKAADTEFRIGGYEWTDLDISNQTATVSNGVTNYTYLNAQGGNGSSPPNNTNGFYERKAHLDFRGTIDKMFGAAIGIESDKSTGVSLGLYHAYLYAKFDKAFSIEAGKMTNPLSLEGLQPSADLPFVEASMIANVTINKVLGLMAEGKLNHIVDYQLMIDNGAQDNESSATGPPKPAGDMKDVTGRIFFTPWEKTDNEWLSGLGFGAAGSIDNETLEDTAPWAKLESSIGGNAFATYGGAMVPDGPYYHVDGQGYYYNGPFGLMAEHVDSIQTVSQGTNSHGIPTGVPVQLDNQAWLAEVQWVIGGKAGFEGATVDNPFNPSKGRWGALELVARIDENFIDVKSFTTGFPYAPKTPLATGAQLAIEYAVGFNWWLNENFKFMCDGEDTDFSGGTAKVSSEQMMVARAAFIL